MWPVGPSALDYNEATTADDNEGQLDVMSAGGVAAGGDVGYRNCFEHHAIRNADDGLKALPLSVWPLAASLKTAMAPKALS